ncbi:MAG: extracellular solute-binding protein [Lachnospiraceae bacterium]|nr:extracellular solute-binding protein [Lachnospiraceae bacterium]
MNRRKKISIGGLAVCAAALLAGACIYQSKKTTVLEVGIFAGSNWDVANANSYVIIDKAVEKFEATHKNVKVHYYSGIRKEDYSEWFSRQLLRGKEPDVFMVLGEDFNQFAEIGIMKDLEPLMGADPEFDKNAYYATTLRSGQYDGRQYALPYETVPMLMFVNKSLLNKEGLSVPDNDWTWDDLYQISERITKDRDGDGLLDQFGMYNYGWMEAAYSNGAELFDENGRESYFNDDKVTEAVRFAKQISDLSQMRKVTKDDFDAGNVAFMPLPFTEYRTYKTYPYKIKKYTKFQWDCITLPAGKSGGNTSVIDTLLMGISSNTNQERLAWEFLKLLTYDEEIQMDLFRYSQGVSVLKEVTQSKEAEAILQEDMEKNEKFIDNRLVSDVIENGVVTPKFQKYSEVITMADSEINRIIENDDNIENSMRILQRQINQYLRR